MSHIFHIFCRHLSICWRYIVLLSMRLHPPQYTSSYFKIFIYIHMSLRVIEVVMLRLRSNLLFWSLLINPVSYDYVKFAICEIANFTDLIASADIFRECSCSGIPIIIVYWAHPLARAFMCVTSFPRYVFNPSQ